MPKLYFTDPGLASYLAGIRDIDHLANHPLKGALFETFMISELLKKRFNLAQDNNLYFWRDKIGHEIDCLMENANQLTPIELKSGRTISDDYFKNMNYWNKLSGNVPENSYIVYGGSDEQKRRDGNVISWNKIHSIAC